MMALPGFKGFGNYVIARHVFCAEAIPAGDSQTALHFCVKKKVRHAIVPHPQKKMG